MTSPPICCWLLPPTVYSQTQHHQQPLLPSIHAMDMNSMLCLQKIAEMQSQRVLNPEMNKNGEQQLQAQCSSEQCQPAVQHVEEKVKSNDPDEVIADRIGESARNRFGRPYISGRPLLLFDRKKIIRLYKEGQRKIAIARQIGITHSCVSKVIRRYEETGELDNKISRTASCACPGEAETHDPRVCRHERFKRFQAHQHQQMAPAPTNTITANNAKWPSILSTSSCAINLQLAPKVSPKYFTVDWILSSKCG